MSWSSSAQTSSETINPKWFNFLTEFYSVNGQQPNDKQLYCFQGIVGSPEAALRDWFLMLAITNDIPECTPAQFVEPVMSKSFNVHQVFNPNLATFSPKQDTFGTNLLSTIQNVETGKMDADAPIHADNELHETAIVNKKSAKPKSRSEVSFGTSPLHEESENSQPLTSSFTCSRRILITDHPSLRSLILQTLQKSETQCSRGQNQKKNQNCLCELNCGTRLRDKTDRERHENQRFPSCFWFCIACGDPDHANPKSLFIRLDKFKQHIKKHRQLESHSVAALLSECKINSVSLTRRCRLCRETLCLREIVKHVKSHIIRGEEVAEGQPWFEEDNMDEQDGDENMGRNTSDNDDDTDDTNDDDDSEDDDEDDNGNDFGNRWSGANISQEPLGRDSSGSSRGHDGTLPPRPDGPFNYDFDLFGSFSSYNLERGALFDSQTQVARTERRRGSLRNRAGVNVKHSFRDVFRQRFDLCSKTGTSTWQKQVVGLFTRYLLTDATSASHSLRQGRNAPQLGKAYQKMVQNLKNRRHLGLKETDSVALVHEYLHCIKELTNLDNMINNSISVLESLRVDIEIMDRDNPSPASNITGDSILDRVNWAIGLLRKESALIRELVRDLQQSLTTVCCLVLS
jgi:hypothetical protein